MKFRMCRSGDEAAVVRLMTDVFAAAAGEAEGELIGGLAQELLAGCGAEELFVFVADEGSVVGAIFFSRLQFDGGGEAFVLGPVAVDGVRQGEGVGQGLIRHGLAELGGRGVEVVLTYGDPAFYGRVGFRWVAQDEIRAPYELSQPEGWLVQSLVGKPVVLGGSCRCVAAFRDPVFW